MILEYLIVAYILLFCVAWIIFRKKPVIKIDTALPKCKRCKEGNLHSTFSWWRLLFTVWLPPGFVFVLGNPETYVCSSCGDISSYEGSRKCFTRISLSNHIPITFAILQIALIVCAIVLVVLYSRK